MPNSNDDAARLKGQLDDLLRRHVELVSRYDWALAVATELARRPRGVKGLLAQCLPAGLWQWFHTRRLRKSSLFDLRAYRSRYPDTERSKFGPLAHFLRWGIHEGRAGGPNRAAAPISIAASEVAMVVESTLFDPQWFVDRQGLQFSSQQEAARHYLTKSQADPLCDPGPLFSGAFYILENPDTARVNPLLHYLTRGLNEGRRAFAPAAADRFMEAARDEPMLALEDLINPQLPTVVLCWQQGNFFFEDIASYLCELLEARGLRAEKRYDDAGIDARQTNLLVVAPHEYCIHGPGKDWSQERFSQAVHVNTEQWHTSWFSLALGVMLRSGKALDINPASARGLARLGIAARFLPIVPGIGETFQFPRAPLAAQTATLRAIKPLDYPADPARRTYDILYVAALNERRALILASLAPYLAKHDCFLHTPALQGPVAAGSADMIPSADISQLARNAKVLLNIHQGESRYFEWHRLFVSGICEGCVVVTEPCVDTGILIPGVHYLEVEAAEMGPFLDWLLGSAEGAEQMATIRDSCAKLRGSAVELAMELK